MVSLVGVIMRNLAKISNLAIPLVWSFFMFCPKSYDTMFYPKIEWDKN